MSEKVPETPKPVKKPAAVVAPAPAQPETVTAKISNIKRAFLYVLVGGLVVSAIISISAILIGEFNSIVSKALLTTLVFMTHSLLVLGIILADRDNLVGKSLVPTVILGSVIASMLTSSLGIWQIWGAEYSWRAISLYALIIGATFLYTWTRQLRINHTITKLSANVALGVIALLTLALSVWIIAPESGLVESPFFYRAIGALTVLGITAVSVSAIFNRVAVNQNPELAQTAPREEKYRGGMLAIVIIVGSIVGLFWFIGLFGLIASGVSAERKTRHEDRLEIRDSRPDRIQREYDSNRYYR